MNILLFESITSASSQELIAASNYFTLKYPAAKL